MRAFYFSMLAAIGTITAIGARNTGAPVGLSCLRADASSLTRIQAIKYNLAASDTQSVSWRVGSGLVGVDSGIVIVVADSTVCTRVTHVVDSVLGPMPSVAADLVVLRVGPRYIAFEPEGSSMFFLDTTFVFTGLMP